MVVETSVLVSALAGAGSFFSPCILPILPAFISYLSGTTLSEVQNQNRDQGQGQQASAAGGGSSSSSSVTLKRSTRLNIFLNTVYFVLGFSLVFAVLGVIFNSVLAGAGAGFQGTLQAAGGIVIIVFGAYLILSTKIAKLNFEKRMTNLPKFKTSYITSFVFGAAFASGWTPCVGPILGSTLALAATSPGAAYNSLLAYAIGLGVPFLITGAFFSQATGVIRRMVRHLKYFNLIMGGVLILLGILVFTNQLAAIANFPLADQIINLERGI
ncbi:cytochrome c biogenesis CcdA family protein [Nitrososphaera viennensis]|uniref:Disulfide Bond oxidoreductase D family protein n=2 Tax=Nitrososphaera viennensis TaxID=1034015 RepID=A0A060HTW4_9ARCH|nr:cytochrome c biogenesis protein CcdA [Nitrososphaera viennensis]AIC16537.1 Disulfide Bond oxidoreductase D family protein [Nitrososphaera viennensis EN76]UVS68470.1 cytochrome c biogenesis protein CcdA [Nitrososphaera viennensis]